MALPWEKYQGTAVADAPPWEKYQNAAATDSPPWEKYTPTAVDLSTLEAPEGSPQREEINRSVAGNLFAPPGVFARDPTLDELIKQSLGTPPDATPTDLPPLPEQGAFEQGGVLGVTVPAAEAGGELVGAMVPHDWRSYLAQVYPPAAAGELGGQLAQGDISGIPLVGRIPEIMRAEQTPGFSKERYLTALRTLMDVGALGGAAAEHGPSALRTEPLAPEPPPTVSMGPGTIAGDVSRALERRFTLQDTPPEVQPQLAPAPPIEQTLPKIGQPLPFNPELGPQPQPDFQMPLRTETQQFPPPPPGTPLKGTPLVGPNGSTPAADAAAAKAQGTVRLYHGSSEGAPQAGRDFTTDQQYAADYAAKAQGGNGGKVWYVDVPQGLLKTHDEYGQPMTRVVVSDEIANQAKPLTSEPAPMVQPGDERYANVPQPVTPPPVQTELPESGFNTERAQKIYGKDAVLITKGKSAKAWKAIGQADTRNPYDVLEQARARGIATPEDAANLRAEHQKLLDRARQAYGTPEYTDLAQNAVDFLNASKEVVHGPASDVMRGLQEADEPTYMSPADYDNILRERQMQATPDESSTFEKVANEVRTKDTEARTAAANGQEAIRKYRPNEVVPFDEAADYVKKQIKDLTEPCEL